MAPFQHNSFHQSALFIRVGLLFLLSALLFGLLAAIQYIVPGAGKDIFSFEKLRPLHVSSAVFWILMTAMGAVLTFLQEINQFSLKSIRIQKIQFYLFSFSFIAIIISYCFGIFGGREYWEFQPVFSIPIILGWVLFLSLFFSNNKTLKDKPVYLWMWATGVIFLLFTYCESNLWVIPGIRNRLVQDMTIQWKSYGSMVGAWNMLVYGSSIYLMDKIVGNQKYSRSNMAFGLFFLSLFNLMFNWGHHIYTLPTAQYTHIIGYAVSMTELFILGRIIYLWRQSLTFDNRKQHIHAYWFLYAADIWVFVNLGLAIAMSVPALNIYMHGTHIIVAHTMGTTIGINTMLLLACAFEIIGGRDTTVSIKPNFKFAFLTTNISLAVFFISLLLAGIAKSYWQFNEPSLTYGAMINTLRPYFYVFFAAGTCLTIGFVLLIVPLLRTKHKIMPDGISALTEK